MRTGGEAPPAVLAGIFKDLFGYTGSLADAVSHEDVSGWDSLGHVQLIEELETAFSVRISSAEMLEMTHLGAIRGLLRQRGVALE